MISLPLWALFVVAFGSPLLAFVGVLVAQFIARKGAAELEARSKREETMRNLRWAAELAVSRDDRMSDLGVAQLAALLESDLLDGTEKILVRAALNTVYEDPEYELAHADDRAEVIQRVARDQVGLTDEVHVDVFLNEEPGDEGSDDA